MNLDLFDDMEGVILREREASMGSVNMRADMNGNGSMSRFPKNTPLTMAYVPIQQWGDTYDDDKALSRGTLFPDLDLPFSGGGDRK